MRGLGPNDQHSMFQLYLDGPSDKLYNLVYVKELPSDLTIRDLQALGCLAGKNLSDINRANFLAAQNALIARKRPVRTTIIKDTSAKSIGSLVASSMLEIVILGLMLEINPFDQPGVELIKTNARKLIGN